MYRAMKMLSLKFGNYEKFIVAYSKTADRKIREEFDKRMLPILEVNYDTVLCPEPNIERRLWPKHWPGAIPLACQVRPEEAPWAGK